jgi:hypothetical protein
LPLPWVQRYRFSEGGGGRFLLSVTHHKVTQTFSTGKHEMQASATISIQYGIWCGIRSIVPNQGVGGGGLIIVQLCLIVLNAFFNSV